MKRIGIIGASGMAGSAIFKAAQENSDLTPVGIIRNEKKAHEILGDDVDLIAGDILDMPESMLNQFDVIVDAFGTTPNNAAAHLRLAEKLISIARRNNIRVIFILGAGSLHTGEDHHRVVEDIKSLPGSDAWINTPVQQLKELEYLEGINDVDWLGISPAMQFEAGPATDYIIGKDELLYNDSGDSKLTSGTMAEVVIKEIVDPQHSRERITVANK